MSQQLIDHSKDLKLLRNEGFELEVHGEFVIVHHVPYVNSHKEIKYGSLACPLNLAGPKQTAKPHCHTIHFVGEMPCDRNGIAIDAIRNSDQFREIRPDLIARLLFSNKPQGGYRDYYDKFTTYIKIISSPAASLDKKATAQTFKPVISTDKQSVFAYFDTNSSRANIDAITAKFHGLKIAIVGLGGTGAYVLDLISKVPVAEIHLYDNDLLLQHNAFRAPGAVPVNKLNGKTLKVKYYAKHYGQIHRHIFPHAINITMENIDKLLEMDYVFLCIDKNEPRKKIVGYLSDHDRIFFDVGLGVNIVDDKLIGSLRVTTATEAKNDHLQARIPGVDNVDNEYKENIQIGDLNAMNAFMAVLKWKKICGFYADLANEHNSTFAITTSKLFNDDFHD